MKEFVAECVNERKTLSTIRHRINVFKVFMEWSHVRGYSDSTFHGLPYRSIPKGVVYNRRERFSIEDFQDLLAAAKSQPNKTKAARDYALLRLHFDLTFRSESALEISVPDMSIGEEHRWVQVVQKRYLHEMTKHLPAKTSEALHEWLEYRNRHVRMRYKNRRGIEAGYLFITLQRGNSSKIRRLTPSAWVKVLADLCDRAGIRRMDTQDIRSLSLTQAIVLASREGLDRNSVTAQSGHKSSRSLDSYEGFPEKLQAIFSAELSRLV